MEQGLQYPHSLQAERAVLGGLLLGAFAYSDVTQFLTPDDFYRDSHSKLFKIISDMIAQNEPVELTSVVQKIINANLVETMGGISYVSSLLNQVASTHNIEYYANIVYEKSIRRRLLNNIQKISKHVLKQDEDLPDLLDFAESSILEVTSKNNQKQDWQIMSKVVDAEFLRIQNLMKDSRDVTGITTGFVDLDMKLSGLQRTDLVILAARPAMGKTALALNFALNAAKTGVGVGVFSLEMSSGQLVTRLLCLEAKVNAGAIRTGKISRDVEYPRLVSASDTLYQLPLFIDDTPGLNIMQVRSKARRLVSSYPQVQLLIIDYIGLMGGDPKISRQEQVSASSRGLKALAKELNCCVLALSQLNRGVESRTDKRPVPSDLRESGAIEQDADIISFIYRDEYYNPNTPEPGVAEIIIAKQRNGPTGTVKLAFRGEFTRFDNLEPSGNYL